MQKAQAWTLAPASNFIINMKSLVFKIKEIKDTEIEKFDSNTAEFAKYILCIINYIDSSKISDSSIIEIIKEKNYVSFEVISIDNCNVNIKIDLCDSYVDVFVNGQELTLQSNILYRDEVKKLIVNCFRSAIESTFYKNKDGVKIGIIIKFYNEGKLLYKIGNFPINILLKRKKRSTIKFEPWINLPTGKNILSMPSLGGKCFSAALNE